MVKEPKKEFDLVGDLEFPNPTWSGVGVSGVLPLRGNIVVGSFAVENSISSEKPGDVSMALKVRHERVLHAGFNEAGYVKRKGLKVPNSILPKREKL